MNKYDRRKMNTAARKYCCIVMNANAEFFNIIDDLKSNEEDKLENLPESLKESPQSANIEEAIEQLSIIQESLEKAENAYDEIIDITCTAISHQPVNGIFSCTFHENEPRNKRFQILLTEEILSYMKLRAMVLGISCNELILQAIRNELLKDPRI